VPETLVPRFMDLADGVRFSGTLTSWVRAARWRSALR